MQDLAQRLEELGMSEYTQRFAENDIDIDVLGELTDQDFDRLGVSLGHRRRMLRAIPILRRREVPKAAVSRCSKLVCAKQHYSITSSARTRNDSGIVSPSAFAVLRLITSSNLVGCSTGKSAGLAPLAMRSTYSAARRIVPSRLTP